jgi:UDP-N-acetylmuramoylalanine--D-glutamate ligase
MSQKVAIVGYGVEGKSAHHYFAARDAKITIFDEKRPPGVVEGTEVRVGPFGDFTGYDLVVRSPSIQPDRIHTNGRVTSVTKEFFAEFGTERIIGITASKGKGTTASLVYEMLKAAGKRVHLAGNIGVPALDVLAEAREGDYVVLELSSFQLWDLSQSPHIAIVGMITPDHLDVHHDFEDYLAAKANIAKWQKPDDIIIYHPSNEYARRIAEQSPATLKLRFNTPQTAHIDGDSIVIGEQRICQIKDVRIPGKHNLENICAALSAAWQITQDIEALGRAIGEYKGLEHRLELVREVNGVTYYDDSFAASTSSAVVAAQAFEAPKVMILGGYDRGIDLRSMVDDIAATRLRKVLLIGQTAPRLAELFRAKGTAELIEELDSPAMVDIVARAQRAAQKGDVVILSPGCASFDMFKDYKDRGNQFKVAVKAL